MGRGQGLGRGGAPGRHAADPGAVSLEGLEALPFLTGAAYFERLEGTANAETEAETRGTTERELEQNLTGKGQVTFRDGAIVANVAAMAPNAANAFLNPEAGEARRTDFAELGGSSTIENGVLRNDDTSLQAPALRSTAAAGSTCQADPEVPARAEGRRRWRARAASARWRQRLGVPVITRVHGTNPAATPQTSAWSRGACSRTWRPLPEEVEQLAEQGKAVKDAPRNSPTKRPAAQGRSSKAWAG